MKILSFDTSTEMLSVALYSQGRTERSLHERVGQEHSTVLARKIKTLMRESQWSFGELDLVVCGTGPGSFTGIRIASASAKAISAACGCAVRGVSSFYGSLHSLPSSAEFVAPLLDARKGNVYTRIFRQRSPGAFEPVSAYILATWQEVESSLDKEVLFFGPGLDTCLEEVAKSSLAKPDRSITYEVRADLLAWKAGSGGNKKLSERTELKPLYLYSDECTTRKS